MGFSGLLCRTVVPSALPRASYGPAACQRRHTHLSSAVTQIFIKGNVQRRRSSHKSRRPWATINVSSDDDKDGSPQPIGRKANLVAKRKERISLPTYVDGAGRNFPISEFLTHSSGVEAMLNTRSLQSFEALDANTYRCTLQTIQFMKFEVVPVIDLRLTYTTQGCTVEMFSCKFKGSEALKQQNNLFSAFMRNRIAWDETSSEPCLDFDVCLYVTLQVYTKPFTLLPLSVVETPGNVIMQGLVDRLVPSFIEQILEDYQTWVAANMRNIRESTNATQ